ncbi:zinc finger protein 391-like [Episyrphus balteatus]|uniref:zinc finger protein 391-like n=1 Tax=Episyrphus balteatus TaxID=286459 RepID=UPI002485EEA8|nr:zinc finger protein 391-like [Episyrphus balteatus]
MDSIQLYEFHKMCRVCLKNDLLVSIFSPTFLVRPIDMVEKLNIFKFNPDDNLPTMLCQSCLYRLVDAYNLKQLAESSESRLHEYLNSTNQLGGFAKPCITISSISNDRLSIENHESTFSSAQSQIDRDDDIYDNICDIFDRNNSNDIEVEDDVLNDVVIDVSTLTRSDAEDTIQDTILLSDDLKHEIEIEEPPTVVTAAITPKVSPKKGRIKKKENKPLKVPEQCNECGKIFEYPRYLESHMRIHTGEKPFQCDICHKSFAQSSNLVLHSRVHTGERRYQCEICSRFFTTTSNLKAHKLTHSEERVYECAHCDKRFKTQRDLVKHEPVHRETKDIVCEICKKTFLKMSYLNVHVKAVHKGIKNHKCTGCNKIFANKSNLVCHMRIHTGEKPYQCKDCPSSFNQSSALVRHSKKHLKKGPPIGIQLNEKVELEDDNNIPPDNSIMENFLPTEEEVKVEEFLPSVVQSSLLELDDALKW